MTWLIIAGLWSAFLVGYLAGAWIAGGRQRIVVLQYGPVGQPDEDGRQDVAEESYLPQGQ